MKIKYRIIGITFKKGRPIFYTISSQEEEGVEIDEKKIYHKLKNKLITKRGLSKSTLFLLFKVEPEIEFAHI